MLQVAAGILVKSASKFDKLLRAGHFKDVEPVWGQVADWFISQRYNPNMSSQTMENLRRKIRATVRGVRNKAVPGSTYADLLPEYVQDLRGIMVGKGTKDAHGRYYPRRPLSLVERVDKLAEPKFERPTGRPIVEYSKHTAQPQSEVKENWDGSPYIESWGGPNAGPGSYDPGFNVMKIQEDHKLNAPGTRRHELGHWAENRLDPEQRKKLFRQVITGMKPTVKQTSFLLTPSFISGARLAEAAGHYLGARNYPRSLSAQTLMRQTGTNMPEAVAKAMAARPAIEDPAMKSTVEHMYRNYSMPIPGQD